MGLPWRIIDFCRHFNIDTSAVSDSTGDAAAPGVFSQLALRFDVPLDLAAARLRQQNVVDAHLEEEGVIESDEIALDVLTDKPISCDRTELRKCVSQFLSNRRRRSAAVGSTSNNKDSTESVPLVNIDSCSSADEQWKKLISIEASLFTIAVNLARKEEELHRFESALETQSRTVKEREDNLQQTMEAMKLKTHNLEVDLEKKRTELLIDTAKAEERRLSLEQMEEKLKNHSKDVLAAERILAAAQVQLKAEQAKLILEQATLKQDQDQCSLVAEKLFVRERKIKEAEEKLVRAKNDLIAYEASLSSARAF